MTLWTDQEDLRLRDFVAGGGVTLRDLAQELGRTYYACRTRRKLLISGQIKPGQALLPRKCRCGNPIPQGSRSRRCEACRKRSLLQSYKVRYRSGSEATQGAAKNRFSRWTEEDDALLLQQPITIGLARRLGRTLKSCYARRERLARRFSLG